MFAQRLNQLRKQNGLSQSELARKAGITSQAVSQLESGVRRPRLETAEALAKALEVSVDVLLRDPAPNAA